MTDTPRTDAERLVDLAQKMREREQEHRKFLGFPCQSESAWHADEIGGWADELEALLRARRGGAPQLMELVQNAQSAAECLRIVDFNERKQEFFCRACRYRDPLGPDGNKLHDDNCPWLEFVKAFKQLLDYAGEPSPAHGAAPPQEQDQ